MGREERREGRGRPVTIDYLNMANQLTHSQYGQSADLLMQHTLPYM